ncbi:MAG: DUF2007 domain-containing protein [Oscillochloris sp.]|nr:DUF2007 domain-containing protein [Oscillochloris sp.]
MQRVYSSPTPAEAHLVQDYLAQAGIQAVIQGSELGGLQGLVPTTETYASVWVADEDMAEAEALVREFLDGQPNDVAETAWQCPNCGEEIEPQFSDCWNCGTSRIG